MDLDKTSDSLEINNAFKDFYISFYATKQTSTSLDFNNLFLNNLDIPSIGEVAADKLDLPITVEELNSAVRTLQSGKCPGPDGYPIKFYKMFCLQLSPLLLEMYNESFENGLLPQTRDQASISLF